MFPHRSNGALMSGKPAQRLLVVAFLIHVAAVMGYLLREGRLAVVPIYDDVAYLIDALRRLPALEEHGVLGLLVSFVREPPHGPLTVLAAISGLLVSSGEPWGAYLLNAVLWGGVFLAMAWLSLRKAAPIARVGILVAIIASPVMGFLVAELRPDPVWGLLIGGAVALLASVNPLVMWKWHLVGLGALFGLAALAKPSALPATIVVLGGSFVVQIASASFVARSTAGVGRTISWTLLGALTVLVPYLIFNGQHVVAYILMVFGSENEIWRTEGSLLVHLTYYLNPITGRLALGWVWYGAPILLVCAFVALAWRGDKRSLIGGIGVLVALALAYVITAASGVKSLMIGSILYGTIIGATIWSAGRIVEAMRVHPLTWFAGGVALALVAWTPMAGMFRSHDPAMVATNAATDVTAPLVLEAMARFEGTPVVLVTAPGPIYAGTLNFFAIQAGYRGATFRSGYTWGDRAVFDAAISSADIIVVSEPGMVGQGLGFNFPSIELQSGILNDLRNDGRFVGRRVYVDPDGLGIWLFERRV